MPKSVVRLTEASAQDPALAGGKAAALAQLIAAALPVPEGFVITTEAFARSMADLLPEIEAGVARVDEGNLQALQQVCAGVAERTVSHQPHAQLVKAVQAAYTQLGEGAVSVRSSATAEDMPEASFAGQYDSFLNVLNAHDVVERMLHVWASLYSAHAVAYRRRQGIPDTGMRMAVIVQRQLPADAAGVLFTRDPVSGADDRFVVNATFGLGEGVVSGHMATDHFGLHPQTGEVTSRKIATKEHMMARAPDGGLHNVVVERERQGEPSLSDQHLADLAGLARAVKELFGGHQDIEFAVVDGSVQLLQARPVTAIDPRPEFAFEWQDPADAGYLWMLGQIGQRKAVPAKRLEEDAMRFYEGGSRVCFEETGSPIARMHISRFVHGYRYIRSPTIAEAEVERRLQTHRVGADKLIRRGVSWWESSLRPQVQRALDELELARPRVATLPSLVEHLERAMATFGHVLGDLHWRMAASREDPMEWAALYAEATGRPPLDAGAIVQATDNQTTRMVRWLRELAKVVKSDHVLTDIFARRAYERLSGPADQERPAIRSFRRRFRNFLRRYGLRNGRGFGSATNFATPTWNIDPTVPLDLIGSYAKQDIVELERIEADARREREREIRRTRRELANDPERLEKFERALFLGRDYVRLMENHNHMMEQSTMGSLREAVHRLGQFVVREGLIDGPDDVLHISLAELKKLAAGQESSDLRALVREREEEFQRRLSMEAPRTIGSGEPPAFLAGAGPSMMEPSEGAGRDGSVIRGTGASRGRATGRAHVAEQTAEPPPIEKGEILVARNAGPNWTPAFPLIAGLVLDEGAVFQHAALVAREYGIPAVVMAKDATAEINHGQTVTVDGDEGIVELG